jgi:hypothetical protein
MRDETEPPLGATPVNNPITEQERGAHVLAHYGKSGRERLVFLGKTRAELAPNVKHSRTVTVEFTGGYHGCRFHRPR